MAPQQVQHVQHVLRVKRTDHKSEHLLVNITSKGPSDLDLKLIATDQSHIYHGSFKESTVKSLQATNFKGDLEEWKTTLCFALLHRSPDDPQPDFLQGVEIVSSISGTTATITLRKNIDGITQRLGTIALNQDDEKEEIQVFDWVDSAVATSDDLRSQLWTLQESAKSQQDEIAKLSKDLDELVKVKKEHESEMLSKFAALLNAKKLKIRDQQRLLSGARIDADAAEEVAKARASSSKAPRRAGASRTGKRKANGSRKPVGEDVDGDDDDDDAQTEASKNEEDDKERIRQDTPETQDGNATDDDSNDTSGMNKINSAPQTSQRRSTRHTNTQPLTMEVDEVGSSSLPQRSKKKEVAREPTPQPSTANTANDDDDETDDEL